MSSGDYRPLCEVSLCPRNALPGNTWCIEHLPAQDAAPLRSDGPPPKPFRCFGCGGLTDKYGNTQCHQTVDARIAAAVARARAEEVERCAAYFDSGTPRWNVMFAGHQVAKTILAQAEARTDSSAAAGGWPARPRASIPSDALRPCNDCGVVGSWGQFSTCDPCWEHYRQTGDRLNPPARTDSGQAGDASPPQPAAVAGEAPACARCGGPVEAPRHVYTIPTCFGCLPPPLPLPQAGCECVACKQLHGYQRARVAARQEPASPTTEDPGEGGRCCVEVGCERESLVGYRGRCADHAHICNAPGCDDVALFCDAHRATNVAPRHGLIRLAAERAVRDFGGEGPFVGVFNAAGFSVAYMKLAGAKRVPDCRLVRAMLAWSADVIPLRGGAHYRLVAPQPASPTTERNAPAEGQEADGGDRVIRPAEWQAYPTWCPICRGECGDLQSHRSDNRAATPEPPHEVFSEVDGGMAAFFGTWPDGNASADEHRKWSMFVAARAEVERLRKEVEGLAFWREEAEDDAEDAMEHGRLDGESFSAFAARMNGEVERLRVELDRLEAKRHAEAEWFHGHWAADRDALQSRITRAIECLKDGPGTSGPYALRILKGER